MTIVRNIQQKIKDIPRNLWNDLFLVLVIFLVSLASFGLGRLSIIYNSGNDDLEVLYPTDQSGAAHESLNLGNAEQAAREVPLPASGGEYVASRSGSKYHFPWCSGAQRIKEENKVWFASKGDVERAGYTPATNCKGL